ncbi:MAG: hypothetical protein ABI700_16750 [Chloroflexota bacterium]
MPSPFDITTASNTVTLDNNRTGVASFTAKNNIRRRFHATARLTIALADERQPVATLPPDAATWLTIAPPPSGGGDTATSRDFPVDGTQNYQVNIAVPMTAAASSYKIKLTLADEANPDDNFTDGPEVVFTVREIEKKPPTPFPVWIIPAIIIAVIVIIAIIVIAVTSSNNGNNAATQTALAAARQTVDAQTATAAALTLQAQQTQAAAFQTSTAQAVIAQQTQTALNVFLGNWVPVNSGSTISALGIEDAGSNRVNISYSTLCPPNLNLCLTSNPQPFKITNVPFNPLGLAAGIGNTTLLIQPSNSNQLVLTVTVTGFTTSQNFKRVSRFPGGIILENPILVSPSIGLSEVQINGLRNFAVATPTATP